MSRFLSCLLSLLFITWATCVTSTCNCCDGKMCQTWLTCTDSNNDCHHELKMTRESHDILVANLNATCQTKLDNLKATCITDIANERKMCDVDRLKLANCSTTLTNVLNPSSKTWGEAFGKFVDGTIGVVSDAWNKLWAPLKEILMLLVILVLLCIVGWCMFRCGIPWSSRAGGERRRTAAAQDDTTQQLVMTTPTHNTPCGTPWSSRANGQRRRTAAAQDDTTPNAMPVQQLVMTTPTHNTPYTTNLNDLTRDALNDTALAYGIENPQSMTRTKLIPLIQFYQHNEPW